MAIIKVRHNMEMAHRLSQTPGKCEAIHGHSWWAELSIKGPVDATGKVLEFGDVKRAFRSYLDTNFDHKLLLYIHDPVAKAQFLLYNSAEGDDPFSDTLPGLQVMGEDPTTENVAKVIYFWGKTFVPEGFDVRVDLWETSVNCASIGDW